MEKESSGTQQPASGQMFDEWKIHEVFIFSFSGSSQAPPYHLINESFSWGKAEGANSSGTAEAFHS
jgi:hypothetical protein